MVGLPPHVSVLIYLGRYSNPLHHDVLAIRYKCVVHKGVGCLISGEGDIGGRGR